MRTFFFGRATAAWLVIGILALAGSSAGAQDNDATAASPHCENVQITVRNASGQPIKLISVDYRTTGRWSRGRIVFRTIADGASHTWTGSFKDMAGQEARFRVNTRYVIDAQTDRYSELKSDLVTTRACTSEEQHDVTVGKPRG